jgi:rhamnosyltransferase
MLVFFSILYDPQRNAVENVLKAKKNGLFPVVYINTASVEFVGELANMDVVILGENKNIGLGKAFENFEVWAKGNSVKKFIYFDQDTYVSEDTWKILDSVSEEEFSRKDVGLVFFTPRKSRFSRVVISSGCMFSIDKLDQIGLHDGSFFVEGVDYEFCLRLHHLGYSIRKVYTSGIDHHSLQDYDFGEILGKKIVYRCYGLRRLGDFNRAHFRLIMRSIKFGEIYFTYYFVRSLLSFNLKEIYSQFWRFFFS